jgi:hypothetical protein
MGRSLVIALVLLAGTVAHAENITIGVFAPSAPFPSTAARVELASRLGEHLGKALGGTGTGRVYARAGDFAAAVRNGTVTIALVDATYLAGTNLGPYSVIAGSVRGNATATTWQLVARGGGKIDGLKGKRILVPANGGRETDLLLNVMLGGVVAKDHFGKIDIRAPFFGNDPCPTNDVWLRDNDLVIVPKTRILCATDVINLYFTRGVYAAFPISYVYSFNTGSSVTPIITPGM